MPRKQKLKVYRTPIGFHDAYVAAPSQKGALEAWGADVDLFSRGVAERVDDQALIEEPLAKPGTVIRRPRGTSAEHLAALPADRPIRKVTSARRERDDGPPPRRRQSDADADAPKGRPPKNRATPPPEPRRSSPRSKAKPRPSRKRLDEAERSLEQAQRDHDAAVADLRARERDLQEQRRTLERSHAVDVTRLEAKIASAKAAYSAAVEKWRA